jgi:hypothetical protein
MICMSFGKLIFSLTLTISILIIFYFLKRPNYKAFIYNSIGDLGEFGRALINLFLPFFVPLILSSSSFPFVSF